MKKIILILLLLSGVVATSFDRKVGKEHIPLPVVKEDSTFVRFNKSLDELNRVVNARR